MPPNFFNLFVTVVPLSFKYLLIDGADEIFADKSIGKFKPNLSIFKNGKPFKVIEVIFSGDISEKKTKFYIENKIDVVKIYVKGFSLVERIQETMNYLPLTFVSVTINRERNATEENANLVELENRIEPYLENYFTLIGKTERIQEIIDSKESHLEGMRRMPIEAIAKMKSLAQQICDICNEIQEIAEENGLNTDDFDTYPFFIEDLAEGLLADLDAYKK